MAKYTQPVSVSAEFVKKISKQLTSWFTSEKPTPDYVEVVPGSIKAIDVSFRLYKALVKTEIFIGGLKQHVSNIRFKTDAKNNLIPTSITFS